MESVISDDQRLETGSASSLSPNGSAALPRCRTTPRTKRSPASPAERAGRRSPPGTGSRSHAPRPRPPGRRRPRGPRRPRDGRRCGSGTGAPGLRPAQRLLQFVDDEGLEQGAQLRRRRRQPTLVEPDQVRRQPGVDEVQLGSLDEALAQVRGPRRQPLDEKDRLEESEIPVERRQLDAGAAGQLADVEQAGTPGRQQSEQRRHRHEAVHVGDVPHVPLQDGGDVRREPGVTPPRVPQCAHLREAAHDDEPAQKSVGVHRRDIARRECPAPKAASMNEPETPRASLSDRGQSVRTSIRPARDSESRGSRSTCADPVRRKRPGRRSRSTVALRARNSSGHELDLVEDDVAGEAVEEADGVPGSGGQRGRVVEREIAGWVRAAGHGSASVLFPLCRAPTRRVTGRSPNASSSRGVRRRSIMCTEYPVKVMQINHLVGNFYPLRGRFADGGSAEDRGWSAPSASGVSARRRRSPR